MESVKFFSSSKSLHATAWSGGRISSPSNNPTFVYSLSNSKSTLGTMIILEKAYKDNMQLGTTYKQCAARWLELAALGLFEKHLYL